MDPNVLSGLLGLDYGEDVELDYKHLRCDAEFQRGLKARNWDTFVPALFGRAIVCEVDEQYFVVDGIHRVTEGERHGMWGNRKVPTVTYRNCTIEQAAGLFNLLNVQRVALKAADNFRSSCFSGDTESRLLDAALLDMGLDGWCMNRAERNCEPIGTVVRIANSLGREHVLYTLDTISEIWSWEDKDDPTFAESSPHMKLVQGFSEYLRPSKRIGTRRYPRKWDPRNGPVLTEWIRANYPGQEGLVSFIARAQMRRKTPDTGGSVIGVELQIHDCLLKAKRAQREAEAA